jgi:hypothetical protein
MSGTIDMKQLLAGYYEGTVNGVFVRIFKHQRFAETVPDRSRTVSEWRLMIGRDCYAGAYPTRRQALEAARRRA